MVHCQEARSRVAGNKFNGFRVQAPSSRLNGQSRTLYIDKLVTSALTVPSDFHVVSAAWTPPLARIGWKVNSEISINRYIIERDEGGGFEEAGSVQAVGTIDTAMSYEFVDTPPPAGVYQYRVRQITNDGAQETSPVVEVNAGTGDAGNGGLPGEYDLSPNFPNPFNPTTRLKFALPVQSHVALTIYNVLGQVADQLVNEVRQAGFHTVEWNARVASGTYYCRMDGRAVRGGGGEQLRRDASHDTAQVNGSSDI